MTQPLADHARTGTERVGAITFDRRLSGLSGIAIRGFLLSLVTFGIYRFWYVTELRRYFWSRTIVDGSPGEYTGRGKELFLGFLVAIAILIPIYVAIFIATISVPWLAPFGSILSFLILFVLGQFAIYRGRRYRASRTLWRGIRLGQDGSAITYAAMAIGWSLLTLATLGLAFPFMRASLERYRIDHTLIGSSRMASSARGRSLLLPWLMFYVVVLLPIAAAFIAFLVASDFTIPDDLFVPKEGGKPGETQFNSDYNGTPIATFGAILMGTLGFTLPLGLLLIPFYRARETRIFVNAASLGPVRLSSTLKARQFYWPYIVYLLSIIGFVLLLGLVIGGGALLLHAGGTQSGAHWAIVLGMIVGYLGGALFFAVLYVRVITARLWAAVATTTTIENAGGLDAVLASSRRVGSGLNEGLADALDVGGALEVGF
ncbi:YjgN family protein [Methylobacterium marchantiae]|uniref:YjgN family protein n=1 Tax=Methylobacterium marchantiae TaxID=600331 RepID=A0ABW3WZ24_9HYPH|nr:hypothetical protein AIGOOFII_1584 [Methylobacterium marchantiae]